MMARNFMKMSTITTYATSLFFESKCDYLVTGNCWEDKVKVYSFEDTVINSVPREFSAPDKVVQVGGTENLSRIIAVCANNDFAVWKSKENGDYELIKLNVRKDLVGCACSSDGVIFVVSYKNGCEEGGLILYDKKLKNSVGTIEIKSGKPGHVRISGGPNLGYTIAVQVAGSEEGSNILYMDLKEVSDF